MKTPTTPVSIDIDSKRQITREFLESQGWVLQEDKPLFETYKHSRDSNLRCSISLYGGFSIVELHWMNQDPEIEFTAQNPNLTKEDYFTIVKLLNIKTLCQKNNQE